MALADQQRQRLHRAWMRELSQKVESVGALSKSDMRAAVNAVDAWVEANQGAFNSALPTPARTQLTARQKARLLALVLQRRWEVL